MPIAIIVMRYAIFTISIRQQKKDDPNTVIVAKFNLIDLVSLGCSTKTQATGERFKENVHNKELLDLKSVISQLCDIYTRYRDSKLTRLLQESLDDNSMTLMMACISLANYNLDDTLRMLKRYADWACKRKNKPIINQDPKVAEINRWNKKLVNQKLGITCPKEHEKPEGKCNILQQNLRDMMEKLNLKLEIETETA